MPQKLRWGFLSTARINRALIPPLRSSPRSELVAVASRDLAHAQAYAKEWQIPRGYGSYSELLADPEIEVVYISLPNSLHSEWTIKACQEGKHVLCEKPLATSVEDVDAIRSAASQAGVVVSEAFAFPHHKQTLKVIDLIKNGALGRLRYVRGSFTFSLQNPENIRWDPNLGGGALWDVGCYPICYTRRLLESNPVEVFGWQETSSSGVDKVFVGQMRFPNGVIAQMDASFVLPPRSFVEIHGEQASLYIPSPYKHDIQKPMTLRRNQVDELISLPEDDSYIGEMVNLEEAILEGKPQRISLEESRGNTATILALLASAKLGKSMTL